MKKEKFDIIIQAGQSNAEGYGRGESEETVVLSEKVYRLEANKTIKTVYDDSFGENQLIEYDNEPFIIEKAQDYIDENHLCADFSISFCNLYEKKYLCGGRKILVVRAAVGGTGFYKGHWGVGKQLYCKLLEMVNYALDLNPENRLVAFLWHQGEHEAVEKNPPEIYEKQLLDMFIELRKNFGEIPFITADFCRDWADRHLDVTMPIRNKIRNVTKKVGGLFVETDGLLSNDEVTINADIIHFSKDAQYKLGHRYFDAYEELLNNQQKN